VSAVVTTAALRTLKQKGEKIACLTSYDSSFTRLIEAAGAEVILIGDSLGMVVQGHDSTLPVTLDDMCYHAACVARAGQTALRIVDMPFMSYADTRQALESAARLMREGGAHMVKLEGGQIIADTVRALTARGIPVCAHLGLIPQSVNQMGGYRVQGRDEAAARQLLDDARLLQDAGASAVVLECVPTALAQKVTAAIDMPTIGIGAGPHCDGQVLVLYDMLGIVSGKRPKFTRDFLAQADGILQALQAYVAAVKDGSFPASEHSYD
jgi:3-methyl-2-oxobutanoate hydroxymethyltransferase